MTRLACLAISPSMPRQASLLRLSASISSAAPHRWQSARIIRSLTYNPANTITLNGLANVQVAASIRGQLSLINDTTNNSLDVQINSITSGAAFLT